MPGDPDGSWDVGHGAGFSFDGGPWRPGLRPAQPLPLLVDQGTADPFLETQLQPQALAEAAAAAGQPLELRLQPGHEHSDFAIASFIDGHLHHHARVLLS